MKTAGLVIAIMGLAIMLFTGFNYLTREKVVDIGGLDNTSNTVSWLPLIGVVVLVAGVGVYRVGQKKQEIEFDSEIRDRNF